MIKHAVGAALFATATHSAALSLGGTLGNALIGRPLDLMVRSSIDPSEAVGGLCLEAELLYGDSRVPASAVSVSIHKLASDGSGALRVRSSQPVNEPVVTLVIKAGCSSRFTRSYALLADYLPQTGAETPPVRDLPTPRVKDVLEPVRPAASNGASTAPSPVRVSKADAGMPARPSVRETAGRESPIRLQPPQPRPAGVARLPSKQRPGNARPEPSRPEPAAAPAPQAGAPLASESRLKLDLVDLAAPEREQLPGPGRPGQAEAPATQDRGDAPALAGADADQAGSDPRRLQEMVRELEGLRSEQQKMRAAVEAVHAQLAQASAPRYLDPLVLGLAGVCSATLAALAWLWSRLRRQQRAAAGLSVLPSVPRD